MTPWQVSKAQADKYTDEVIDILKNQAHLFVRFVVADEESDQKRNTDFIVKIDGGDIACRVRGMEHWYQHGDITIRNSRPSGVKTEADKIIDGFGRWMFYGWADDSIKAWVLIDLNMVRIAELIQSARKENRIRWNKDGSSSLTWLTLKELTDFCAIDASGGDAAKRLNKMEQAA